MKTNYSINARWLQGAASTNGSEKMQVNPRKSLSKEGLSKDESSTRLRVDYVSFTSRLRVWQRVACVIAVLFALGVGNVWGDTTYSWTCSSGTFATTATALSGSSDSNVKWTASQTGVSQGTGVPGEKCVQLSKNTGLTLTTSNISGTISSIVIQTWGSQGNTLTCEVGSSYSSSQSISTSYSSSGSKTTFSSINSSGTITFTWSSASKAFNVRQISITYSTGSCSVDPTIGNPSLTSITSGTISVTCPSISAGSNCAISDYGFVWKASSAPTISDNKTQKGTNNQSAAFSDNLSIAFTTGTTYHIKAYGTNTHGTTLSGTALQVTPRSIAFNSNGGSDVATIYVNSGTAASAPTAPTKTGYTFSKWCTNSTLTTDMNWGSAITENKTLYAKWTVNTYSVRFNKNNNDATGSMSNESYTYGESKALTSCGFSLVGYDFSGWATSSGGSVVYSDGQSVSNLSSTNGATVDLFAKWTVKSYSVTWKVNNTNYSAGGSTTVNHGGRVSTLPTAPDPASYCGDRFMGWTDAADGAYVHGTSTLFTTAGTAPVASGAQVFYAVFADYVEK